jgi:hypothetical protein
MLEVNEGAPPGDQAPNPNTRRTPTLLGEPASPLPVTLAGEAAGGGGEGSRPPLSQSLWLVRPPEEGERGADKAEATLKAQESKRG